MTEQEALEPTPIQRIAEQLRANPYSLHIKRLPLTTKQEFIAWADDPNTFCGDYGFAFKALWEEHKRVQETTDVVTALESRIQALENKAQEEAQEEKIMVNGARRRVKA